ncbi:MAG: helix-turn-helix transcriptional regulator [Candidatus Elarobacter sp.]
MNAAAPESFLPLSPQVFYVLVALAAGEKHGYAIMRDVEEQSGGTMSLGPGTLYGSLKRLLVQGLVIESAARPDPALDDERRRYYELTGLGRRVVAAESIRLQRQVAAARRAGAAKGLA